MRVVDLRCDHRVAPMAVVGRPRLSWKVEGGVPAETQVRVVTSRGEAWTASAGRRPWIVADVDLDDDAAAVWHVDATFEGGTRARASARFRMAPATSTWDASSWIGLARPTGQSDTDRPCPSLRGELVLPTGVDTARLLITAGGVYRGWVNGTVLDGELLPGFTDYRIRVPYDAYDVTPLLRAGRNVIAAVVADGWWSGYLGFTGTRGYFGDQPVLRAVLEATCIDGSRHRLGTDAGWQAHFGEVRAADLQRGQVDDLRRSVPGWQSPDTDVDWGAAELLPGPTGELLPHGCDPVRVARLQPAVGRHEPGPGTFVYDVGANVTGRTRARLRGEPGSVVRLRHAEALDAQGHLYTANLRSATQEDRVVLAGGEVVHEPVFTTHGFRYVEITGCSPPDTTDVAAVVVSSAPTISGSFRCSSDAVNRLVGNVVGSLQSNFLDIPTDCPQRDERLGWTGDAQVFARTACLLADVAAFFDKWLDDVYDAQSPEGAFPDVAPRVAMETDGAPGWGDAGAIVPWVLWEHFGDRRVLEKAHLPVRAWVEHVRRLAPGLLWRHGRGNDYGDWLAPLPPGDPGLTDKDLLASVFAARSARLLAMISDALGDERAAADAEHAAAVEAAFRSTHLRTVDTWTQTACALALRFGLVHNEQATDVAARLVADVETRGHLTTGFLGVGHLLPALSMVGRTDLAYALLLRDKPPSWLYPVAAGATSVWERWDGWTPDAGFADPEMNSFNHYSLGSVVEWLLANVAGLSPATPGWEVANVTPEPGDGLTWARGEVATPYGRLASGWRRTDEGLLLDVDVPPGLVARVSAPASGGAQVTLAGQPIGRHVTLGYGRWELEVS